ncbi:RtcB family protein [bacterium]|nr:RtcB family protein [bacterium]
MISAINIPIPNKQPSFGNKSTSNTIEVKGTETKAKIYTTNVDYSTYDQIKTICSHPVFRDTPVRIMPDTHAGKNSVVGFTAPINERGEIIPSIISGDIGCGMLCVEVDTNGEEIDFNGLDNVIRKYASTSHTEKAASLERKFSPIAKEVNYLCRKKYGKNAEKVISTLGTLGGGNHFIELDKDDDGKTYLVIHTGSRTFGKEVNNYHQENAVKQNPYKIRDMSYLSGSEAKDYLEDMKLAVKYSQINRRIIADEIIKHMGWKEISSFESIHNYISDEGMIRKGAISSNLGEKILIPLNMRDGAIIAKGKGNKDWNYSAPHGAGRQFSRGKASKLITVDEYKKTMNGIHSSCISSATIDEAPQAYKPAEEIIENIEETAEVEKLISPIFNYKD